MKIKKAIKRLQGWLDEGYYKINKQDSDWSDDKEALELAIQCMNNKKSEERPQGEWINHRNDHGHNIADCSLCGKTMQWHDEDGDGVPRYCWYCGAPMKGVKTETKNPREGMDFKDYLAEKLKDPEFKKEWENVLKEENEKSD